MAWVGSWFRSPSKDGKGASPKPARHKVHLGEKESKFFFDEKLKRWRVEGEEDEGAEGDAIASPPRMAASAGLAQTQGQHGFQPDVTTTSNNNISAVPAPSASAYSDGVFGAVPPGAQAAEVSSHLEGEGFFEPAAMASSGSAKPPMPMGRPPNPSRRNLHSRYVDAFQKDTQKQKADNTPSSTTASGNPILPSFYGAAPQMAAPMHAQSGGGGSLNFMTSSRQSGSAAVSCFVPEQATETEDAAIVAKAPSGSVDVPSSVNSYSGWSEDNSSSAEANGNSNTANGVLERDALSGKTDSKDEAKQEQQQEGSQLGHQEPTWLGAPHDNSAVQSAHAGPALDDFNPNGCCDNGGYINEATSVPQFHFPLPDQKPVEAGQEQTLEDRASSLHPPRELDFGGEFQTEEESVKVTHNGYHEDDPYHRQQEEESALVAEVPVQDQPGMIDHPVGTPPHMHLPPLHSSQSPQITPPLGHVSGMFDSTHAAHVGLGASPSGTCDVVGDAEEDSVLRSPLVKGILRALVCENEVLRERQTPTKDSKNDSSGGDQNKDGSKAEEAEANASLMKRITELECEVSEMRVSESKRDEEFSSLRSDMNDLLICLGHETLKVNRMAEELRQRGANVEEIITEVEENI